MDLTTFVARRWWLLPLLFVVTAGTVATNKGSEPQIALGVTAALVLLTIDWWLPAVLANGLLVAAYFATGGDDGPVYLTIVVATFLAASCHRIRRWLPYVVLSGVLVWAGLLVRGLRQDDLVVNAWQSVGTGALVAAAAAIATAMRSRSEARSAREQRTATEERLRMAQDLHDGVGHGLSVIAMQAGVALHVMERDPGKARESLEAIRETSKESLTALRAELAAMSGDAAPRRPSRGLADLPALVDRVRGAGLVVEVVGAPGQVPQRVSELCFAVVQEALTNVLRHAGAERASVEFDRSDDAFLVVSVTDDGRGSVPGPSATGLGLDSLAARTTELGGTFEAGPLEVGFRVRATLPLTEVTR